MRLREIGIRKVIGAHRSQLFIQFIMESVVLSLIAFAAALYLQKVISELFIGMHPENSLLFKFEESFFIYILFLIFTLLTGLISGFLPALYFSRPRPIDIFTKYSGFEFFSGITFRKILIGLQFSFSLIFVIITISVNNQFNYVEHFDFGINTDNIININLPAENLTKYKNAISENTFITKISASSSIPGIQYANSFYVKMPGSPDSTRVEYLAVDNNYIDNMGLEILTGKNIPEAKSSENERFILINETASKAFGFQNPAEAVNKGLVVGEIMVSIIGVIKDFTYGQYQDAIRPMALRFLPDRYSFLNIRVIDTNRKDIIENLEKKWSELYPNELFIHQFWDEGIKARNSLMQRSVAICAFVTIIAIIIASMGFLGISMYSVQAKIKEISVRKILGAGMKNLIKVLSKEFVILIVISSIISIPISIYLNELMWQSVDNKANLSFGDISFCIILMFSLAFSTIMTQLIKAVFINPVNALRKE